MFDEYSSDTEFSKGGKTRGNATWRALGNFREELLSKLVVIGRNRSKREQETGGSRESREM